MTDRDMARKNRGQGIRRVARPRVVRTRKIFVGSYLMGRMAPLRFVRTDGEATSVFTTHLLATQMTMPLSTSVLPGRLWLAP
jgi:hypothetical protein